MINKSIIEFLAQLSKNNNKEWFEKNRAAYDMAKQNFKGFVEELIIKVAGFDSSVKNLEAKDCIFRINRDVRFSKDKSPYKNNFGAILSPGGKKSFSAGYYFQLQPKNSFIAGGVWQPPAPQISAIRQEIDYNTKEFKKIIADKSFQKYFKQLSDEDKLKSAPKGYDKSHPEIELLKHRSFIVVHKFTDKEILDKDFIIHIANAFKAMHPFNAFLRRACD